MGRELHPIVLYHVFQRVVAAQGREAALTGNLLHVASDYIIETVLLEGSVLVPDHLELPIDLPQQKSALYELEREVVELQKLEVASDEEGIRIRSQFSSCNLHEDPPQDLDGDSWDVEREEIDDFVDGSSSCYEVSAS